MSGYPAATVTRCDSRADFGACPCCGYSAAGEPFGAYLCRGYSVAVGSPFGACPYRAFTWWESSGLLYISILTNDLEQHVRLAPCNLLEKK